MQPAVDLQQAVFDALSAALAPTPVYDDVPQFETATDSDFPFVVIGEDTLVQWGDDTNSGFDATVTIHTWSRGRGRLELKTIQGAIFTALHRQTLTVGTFGTLPFDQIYEDSLLDPDGLTRHGVQRYRVLFGEPHEFILGVCP